MSLPLCSESVGHPRTVSIPDGWSGEAAHDNDKARPLADCAELMKASPSIIVAGSSDPTGESFVRAVANVFEGHPVRYVDTSKNL